MILYPTETLYALGVNALDEQELAKLYALKGREESKAASWLVRGVEDIDRYAELGEVGLKIAQQFLPGPLTLVLSAKSTVPKALVAPDGTIGFRVSTDKMTQAIIEAFMEEYDAPLTCTSANVSGMPTLATVPEILQQFAEKASEINEVHDDGVRKGLATTVVRVLDEKVEMLREGEISAAMINEVLER